MLEGRHYQNAYVTRNLDKAAADFAARADVRHSFRNEMTVDVTTGDGRKGQTTVKTAIMWVGDIEYELMEPVSEAVPILRDWLPEGDELRFHHSCARVDDWEGFRRRLAGEPYPVVFEGEVGDEVKFLFVDGRALLGHYLEFVWLSDQRWTMMGGR
jgi:hypothetical protein